MRHVVVLAALWVASTAAGCASIGTSSQKAATTSGGPAVLVQGVDGTTIAGELLNGSVTVDSGQGELTLLTRHVHSITMSQDVDKLESDSIKVSGKVKDTRFFVKNEHGVFTLSKDRLRKIEFVNSVPQQTTTLAGSATGTTTIRASGAGTASAPAR